MTEQTMMSDFEAVGGQGAVRAVVDDFYGRLLADPQLAPFFTGVDMARLKRHQAHLVTKVLGGPDAYTGRALAEAHARMDITAADFTRVLGHLAAALRDAGVPDEIVDRAGSAVLATEPDIVRAA